MVKKELERYYLPFQCMIVSNSNKFNVEGVSTAQYYILDTLNKEGKKTAKELSELREVSKPAVSKLTKRLYEKNFISFERKEEDHRSYNIIITKEGKDFLERVDDFGNEIMNLIEKALTDEELQEFTKILKKITNSYNE